MTLRLVMLTVLLATSSGSGIEAGDVPARRYLLGLAPGADVAGAIHDIEARGGIIHRYLPGINVLVVGLPDAAAHHPSIRWHARYLEQDRVGPRLHDELPSWVDSTNAERVWGAGEGATTVIGGRGGAGRTAIVAVLDTGIRCDHPDLGSAGSGADGIPMTLAAPAVDGGCVEAYWAPMFPSAFDDYGHGTHVAGIIAMRDNGFGYVGIAPEVRLLAAKLFGPTFNETWISDVVAALAWAVDVGKADVIQMSFGDPLPSQAMCDAVAYAWDRGAVLVASVGNTGGDATTDHVEYPAKCPHVIGVGAIFNDGSPTNFSSTGPDVDVVAPGVSIISTIPLTPPCLFYCLDTLGADPRGFLAASGTSQSAPMVSGVAALLASRGWSNQQIHDRIIGRAVDLGSPGRDWIFGAGRVDAAIALAP